MTKNKCLHQYQTVSVAHILMVYLDVNF